MPGGPSNSRKIGFNASAQIWYLCLLKIPYVLRPLMFEASLDTLRADDFRPGLAGPVGPKVVFGRGQFGTIGKVPSSGG